MLPIDQDIINLFNKSKYIAVIGLSPNENRPSHRVARHLQKFGFDIIPVRPAVSEILGEKVYTSLQEIPFQVDIVNVFRAPKFVSDIVDQCIDKKVKGIWLQEGVVDEDSALRAQRENIFMIMDRCIYKEYMRLMM